MAELELYHFEAWPVRVVLIDGVPWWVAKDVCLVLGVQNVSQKLKTLAGDEKLQVKYSLISNEGVASGGLQPGQDVWLVNEPGVYMLLFGSRKPVARRFTRWVTHEVLPQIRRTGAYGPARPPAGTAAGLLAEVRRRMETQPLAHVTWRNGSAEEQILRWSSVPVPLLELSIRTDPEQRFVREYCKFLRRWGRRRGITRTIKELGYAGMGWAQDFEQAASRLRAAQDRRRIGPAA